ncbi:hypothetical protein BFF78_42085 [Streptomyces fodineus]|uniref:Uncharacterized protein n=1 Tax=Streptomyces fodineus TaxID=1904616 RepID=A0A1D7YMG1_9ACTN|nr:hypothetical protein BFF78_00545 [Streptomyces fodineus]AOR36765.1 hypothetical protein BFF78_42085 [Streptomyces fodineus]
MLHDHVGHLLLESGDLITEFLDSTGEQPQGEDRDRRCRASRSIPNAELKVYEGSSHGIAMVPGDKERFNRDLLEFLNK